MRMCVCAHCMRRCCVQLGVKLVHTHTKRRHLLERVWHFLYSVLID